MTRGLSVDTRPVDPSAGASRLPKHKRADLHNGRFNASPADVDVARDAKTTRLGTKPGLKLRDEVVEPTDDGRRAVSWAAATAEWRGWLKENLETAAVFQAHDPESGEDLEKTAPLENRFMEQRQKRLYAKLRDVERGAREEYGDRLTTVMLTFTASTTSGAGEWWRCPANHLDDLLGSWSAVRRALHRVLDGRRWEYARILEPHKTGHGHVHVAVFVDGPIRQEQFRPVMEAHVEHCLPAAWEAHDPTETNAVHVERDVENLAAYLSSYLMEWGEEPLDAPEHVQRFHTLLWATGRRRYSLSDGAQEWAAFDGPSEESQLAWELTHIEIRQERFPVEDGGGEVLAMELAGDAGLDPPPDRGAPP